MNRTLIFLFVVLSYIANLNTANAQDSLTRFSVEVDIRLVPVLRSFYSDYDFFNMKAEPAESGFLISHTHNNFRTSYSVRMNVSSKSGAVLFGLAAKYSRSTNYWDRIFHPDSAFSMLMTENLVADCLGANFRMSFDPKMKKRMMYGFTIGGGILSGRSQFVSLAYEEEKIPSSGNSKRIQYQSDEILEYDLGYKVQLFDLYLNYNFQYLFNVNKKITLFAGCEVPLLRLFFFNSQARFGLSFNDESFFTSFESFVPHIGNQETANKNFAYSLKKTNSFSLNFGFRYSLN